MKRFSEHGGLTRVALCLAGLHLKTSPTWWSDLDVETF
jgi:hypothetical protein